MFTLWGPWERSPRPWMAESNLRPILFVVQDLSQLTVSLSSCGWIWLLTVRLKVWKQKYFKWAEGTRSKRVNCIQWRVVIRSISLTQAGTMSGFGADSRPACHMNVHIWIDDPHFALLKKVTFTSMATENQEWLLILPDLLLLMMSPRIFLSKMAIMMETASVGLGSEMLNCFDRYLAGCCTQLKPWQRERILFKEQSAPDSLLFVY